jgi:hypothetical protein
MVVGFTACSEFGSYEFVLLVIRRLPPADHIRVEQGLLGNVRAAVAVLMPPSRSRATYPSKRMLAAT